MTKRPALPDLDTMTGDLLAMLAELDAPPLIAPQTYTTDLYPVAEFERSRDAWAKEHGRFGISDRYPGWQLNNFDYQDSASGHSLRILFAAVPREEPDPRGGPAYDDHYRGVCEDCGWNTPIFTERGRAIEAMWLDHAWPGWRDLPAIERVPERGTTKPSIGTYDRWLAKVEATYPEGWGRPGAPIITRPDFSESATRSVPGRSPWGGFDVAHATTKRELPTTCEASTTPPTIDPTTSLLHAGMHGHDVAGPSL